MNSDAVALIDAQTDERQHVWGEGDDSRCAPSLSVYLPDDVPMPDPPPFDSEEGAKRWLLTAVKVARGFLRRMRRLHPELRWFHDQVYDDWLQEGQLKLFK